MKINVSLSFGNWPDAVWRRSPQEQRERLPFIFRAVKRKTWVLLLVVACRADHHKRAATAPADTTALSELLHAHADSARGMTLRTPRVITAPSVVVFWLLAADTLERDSAQSAATDLDYYTEQVASTLAANGIALVPTNADTVYVEQPDHQRRAIVLSGLDYPYGYLLVDPGGPERLLTGVYADNDLRDELDAYFDLPDDADSTRAPPRITTE